MIERQAGRIVYFQFELLAEHPELTHGVTARLADPQRHPKGLNLSFFAAERPEEVVAARHEVCSALGLQLSDLVVPRQVHGKNVAVVGVAHRGRGALDRESGIPQTDALVSAEPGVALFISAADCVPLLFFDPAHKAIGAAHAGWRGTVAKIAAETVTAMARHFGTSPSDLLVAIGPSIGPCCYNVGEEVTSAIAEAFPDTANLIIPSAYQPRLDLWQANRAALLSAGVRAEHIQSSGLCTSCRNDLFFSHRAEQGHAGRFGAFIALCDTRARDSNARKRKST